MKDLTIIESSNQSLVRKAIYASIIYVRSRSQKAERMRWTHFQDLQFSSLGHQKVMLLIGVDAPEAFWVQDKRRGKPGEPYAVKTI